MAANNPSVWASIKLFLKNPQFDSIMQYFLSQISQFGVQVQAQLTTLSSASGLASILNGFGLIKGTALYYYTTDNGTVAGSTAINVAGAASVNTSIGITTAVAITLTINNLTPGVPVMVRFYNNSGSPEVFKMAATNPATTAYTISYYVTGSAAVNLVTTGVTVPAGQAFFFFGNSYVGANPVLFGAGMLT